MKTASAKAKGRSLQKTIVRWLRCLGEPYGVATDDVKSTSMGVSGVDVQLSPAAQRIFSDLAIECKNVEALNVVAAFVKHAEKYPLRFALLFHRRNRVEPLVTMRVEDFEAFFAAWLSARNRAIAS